MEEHAQQEHAQFLCVLGREAADPPTVWYLFAMPRNNGGAGEARRARSAPRDVRWTGVDSVAGPASHSLALEVALDWAHSHPEEWPAGVDASDPSGGTRGWKRRGNGKDRGWRHRIDAERHMPRVQNVERPDREHRAVSEGQAADAPVDPAGSRRAVKSDDDAAVTSPAGPGDGDSTSGDEEDSIKSTQESH